MRIFIYLSIASLLNLTIAHTLNAQALITSIPNATISYTGSPYCSTAGTASVSLTGTTGGTFTSDAGLSINSTTGAVNLSASSAGTHTVTYSLTANDVSAAFSATTNIMITPQPYAEGFFPANPYCSNIGTLYPVGSKIGIDGIISATPEGLSIDSHYAVVNVTASKPGHYTVRYDVPAYGGCDAYYATAPLIISQAPTATIGYSSSAYCASVTTPQSVQITASDPGTFSASPSGLNIDANSGTIIPSGSTPGTYKVSYSMAARDGCKIIIKTTTVTITAIPNATISYSGTPYCSSAGTASVSLTGTKGGKFTSDAGLSIDALTGAVNLSASTAGTHTVTYAITANGGCAAFSTTTNITITTQPYAEGFFPANPYCSNIGTLYPTGTKVGIDGIVSATPEGLSIDSHYAVVNVTASKPGHYTVRYDVPAYGGCDAYYATAPLIISQAPTATISYSSSAYCESVTAPQSVQITASDPGTFSASPSGLNIDANSGTIIPSGSTPGTYKVSYSMAARDGCKIIIKTTTVTITALPNATISYSGTPYCSADGTASISLTGTKGGTFSSDAGLSINASTGAVNLSASSAGAHKVTYTMGAAGGCAVQTATTSLTINTTPSVSATTTLTCVGGSTGTILASGSGGTSSYTFNLNGGGYQSSTIFNGRAAGTYTLGIKSNDGCFSSTSVVVSTYPNSTDDQNAAGTETWIGHIYDGINFNDYKGHFTEPADFDESFGGSGTCFDYTSNSGNGSIFTETFAVKFKMNTSKKGLYVVDLGGDDGTRLYIDSTLFYDNWIPQSFVTRSNVLIKLNGNSFLEYEYFENSGGNKVIFKNLTLVLANSLSLNTEQAVCMGNSGAEISGDSFGTLPSGISLSGTGYQWTYSTSADGPRTIIPGATNATFTPNTSSAPFNVPGTYFVFRNATLNSNNNKPGGGSFSTSNESNVAKITINAAPSATISYANAPFCNSSSNVEKVTLAGTKGGVFSATGLTINSSTGEIVPASNPVGQYTVNYKVTIAGCSAFNTSTQIYIGAPGTWSGKVDNNWNNSGNWICGGIPTLATNATIPVTQNDPLIPAGIVGVNNININDGASLTVLGTLQIAGYIGNKGRFDVTHGTLEFDGGSKTLTGPTAQTISGSWFVNKTIQNLIVSNTKGLSLYSTAKDTLNITGVVSFGNSNCTFNTNNNLTLKSTAAATAGVGDVTNNGAFKGNSIAGNVTVERYINIGNMAGQHNKTWVMVATPTQGKSIYETWMEGGDLAVSGYGTQITGKGTGFDATSVAPALKYFSDANNSWVGVTNTNDAVYNPQGYMLFVRGDRKTGYPNISNTTLRTTGTLLTGSTAPVMVKAGKFQSVGNPYASSVDIRKISASGINPDIIVWDPTLTIGNPYGVGAYQTLYKDGTNYRNLLASSTFGPAGTINNNIESGMAFFVQSFNTNGQVSFTESAKTSSVGKGIAMREQSTSDDVAGLSARLFVVNKDGSSYVADGVLQQFSDQYSNAIDNMDTRKIYNSAENLAITSNGQNLVIERRTGLTATDTVAYQLTGVANQTYRFIFTASGIANALVNGFVQDSYTKKETALNPDGDTQVDFSVTADAASKVANRFKIIFRNLTTMPVTFTSVKASAKNKEVSVDWNVENQSNMKQYEVERSADGNKFAQVAVVNANNNSSSAYNWLDENPFQGNNYYRIRSVDLNGKIAYTSVVKAQISDISVSIKVFPNPATQAKVNLQLNNQPAGVYYARLINPVGQVMVSKKIVHISGNSTEVIEWNPAAARGIYNLQITQPDGSINVIKIKY